MENKLTKEEFLLKLKTDTEFNKKYGRKHITEGKQVLPPCHYGFQVYTRELSENERAILFMKRGFDYRMNSWTPKEQHDKSGIETRAISLMWNQRSVDTFLGLPFNIASYGLLLEIIAKEVNMVPDELIGNLGDVHLYKNHIEQAKEQIGREQPYAIKTYPLPTINFNTEHWDGPLLDLISSEDFCKCLLEEDIQLANYESHPTIKAPLNN
jgi:thymidylate synthase